MAERVAIPAVLALILLILPAVPALAHRVNLFATAEGAVIVGRAFFSGGGAARNAGIVVLGPEGEPLGETRTDAAGAFRFEARRRVDHRLTLDTGDGHRAEFVVAASLLPADLPAGNAPAGSAPAGSAPVESAGAAEAPPPSSTVPPAIAAGDAALRTLVEEAMARQIAPLREQILASEDRVRVRDVLGGLGFILGIAGTAFFFLGRRR